MDIDTWLDRLSAELDLDLVLDNNDIHTLLDLARDAAHQVERLAAPLSTYLVGVAVGRGQTLGNASAKATALVLALDDTPGESDPSSDGDTDRTG